MSNDHKRVTAIFENRNDAVMAMNSLEKMGYHQDDLTLLVSENSWNKGEDLKIQQNTKGPEGAAIGAGVGGIVGAVAAGLTTVGAVAATGGVGLLAAGPIVGALAGAGAGGASGGVIGGLIGLGYPEVEAKYVDEALGKGAVMVGIETNEDRVDMLKNKLETVHAKKITVR